jgi:hypothetical protein
LIDCAYSHLGLWRNGTLHFIIFHHQRRIYR